MPLRRIARRSVYRQFHLPLEARAGDILGLSHVSDGIGISRNAHGESRRIVPRAWTVANEGDARESGNADSRLFGVQEGIGGGLCWGSWRFSCVVRSMCRPVG